jgi:tight adherence protein C
MILALPIILFLVLVTAIGYFGYRRYARPGRYYEHLGGTGTVAMPGLDELRASTPDLRITVLQMIGERMPVSPQEVTNIRKDLLAAGFRSASHVTAYVGLRVVCCVAFALLFLWATRFTNMAPILKIVVPLGGGVLGYFLPVLGLDMLITARQDRLRYALPDALDLMVVCVEAGLGIDQAIQYVGREMMLSHPDLAGELELVNLEIRGGRRRTDALRNLADRTGESELSKLVAVLIQTDRFGTSIAESLRTHSEFLRVRRRQDAEERAGKLGVKLVFPIFFLILPAMLVVAAGPGLLQVMKGLYPLMQQFNNQ